MNIYLKYALIFVVFFILGWLTAEVAKADVFITVDKSSQEMYVDSPQGTFVWPVSTGRKGHNTPVGKYKPVRLAKMHYSKKYDNAPMPNSIFFYNGYAIHATNAVQRLGTPASHGCVRLSPQNAKWLYQIVLENGMQNTHIEIVE